MLAQEADSLGVFRGSGGDAFYFVQGGGGIFGHSPSDLECVDMVAGSDGPAVRRVLE